MKYILFHIGDLPSHISICINTILSIDKESEIIFFTDKKINLPGIQVLNLNDFDDLIHKKTEIIELYKNSNFKENPLWFTSFLRVLSLNTIAKKLNLKEFVHFDNDVLIYEPFSKLNNTNNLIQKSKINITQLDSLNLAFGYSFFSGEKSLDSLEKFFNQILQNYYLNTNIENKGKPINEMRAMKIFFDKNKSQFNLLPNLPYFSEYFLFDPASYGQYLDGTHFNRGNYAFIRRYVSLEHTVGKEIKSKRINIKFLKNNPYVYWNNQTYKLVNLHIHSKNLKKFLPNEYKEYFKSNSFF